MIEDGKETNNAESTPSTNVEKLRERLLTWYDRARRTLPWRSPPGQPSEAYAVWISEIMLQQTTVASVIPYYKRFLSVWPTVEALAVADLDAVLHAWQGLGYYARARNLHKCAKVVAGEHGGRFPNSEEALRRLPGIGAYTAAAIAAIAFGRPAVPVDGNVIRVLARLHSIDEPLPASKRTIEARAQALAADERAGDFAQALMELGATVCTPRNPGCGVCPWSAACRAYAEGSPEAYPVKARKAEKPIRYAVVFWIERPDGAVLLRRRPETGLLGGMMEFPSTDWRPGQPWTMDEAIGRVPVAGRCTPCDATVRHTFTHFHLELRIGRVRTGTGAIIDGIWCPPSDFSRHALPTVMKKVARAVISKGYES
jgi:A/G-specific adenine glycosylase